MVLFKETQRFRQWWLALLLFILIFGGTSWPILKAFNNDNYTTLQFTAQLLSLTLIPCTIVLLVLIIKLQTIINEEGICVRMYPLQRHFRIYRWEHIERAYLRTYKPIREFGGWGIRGLGNNKALNVSGTEGLQLIFKGGEKMLIGTLEPDAIQLALENIKQYIPLNISHETTTT